MQVKKLSHQFSIRSQLLFAITVMVWLPACTAEKRGAGSPDAVVEQYLLALETKNQNLMLELAPENSNSKKAVKAKIDRIGGRKIQSRQITYNKPKPTLWQAKINGVTSDRNGNRQKIEDSIVLEYQTRGERKLYAGRWYLILPDR